MKRVERLRAKNPNCYYCGRETLPAPTGDTPPAYPLTATIDHMIPASRGGGAGANLVLACRDCNELKGDMTSEEFAEAINRMVARGRHIQRTASGHCRQLGRPFKMRPAPAAFATLADVWPRDEACNPVAPVATK